MKPIRENPIPKGPALILGGAPCLIEDMKQAPDGVRIAANWHAAELYDVDFIAHVDRGINGVIMREYVQKYGKSTISPHTSSDYYVPLTAGHPVNTGIYAAWLACQAGCSPVVLAGIEFYQSPQPYYHDKYKVTGKEVRDENLTQGYFNKCIRTLLKMTAGHDVRVISGPLLDYLPGLTG